MSAYVEKMKAVCTNIKEPREGKMVFICTTLCEVHSKENVILPSE